MKIQMDEKAFMQFLKECKKNAVDSRLVLENGLNEIGARLLRRVKQKTPALMVRVVA